MDSIFGIDGNSLVYVVFLVIFAVMFLIYLVGILNQYFRFTCPCRRIQTYSEYEEL